jgi:hypothetical protein
MFIVRSHVRDRPRRSVPELYLHSGIQIRKKKVSSLLSIFSHVRDYYTIKVRADDSNKRIVKSSRFVRDQLMPRLFVKSRLEKKGIYDAEKKTGELPSGAKQAT